MQSRVMFVEFESVLVVVVVQLQLVSCYISKKSSALYIEVALQSVNTEYIDI